MASSSKQPNRDLDVDQQIFPEVNAGPSRKINAESEFSNLKRTRHSSGLSKAFKPFQDIDTKAEKRGILNIDHRFFPFGIQPGTILEIKGPEKSGKTFLVTYIIARVLTMHQHHEVVMIDTRHKFSLKNFINVIWQFDKELKDSIQKSDLDNSFQQIVESSEKILSYLNRITIIPCYSAEHLLLTLGPQGESQLEKLLLHNAKISLVAIDCVDDYSFMEGLDVNAWPNLMELLRESVKESNCPVICTTLMMALSHDYWRKKTDKNPIPSTIQDQEGEQNFGEGRIVPNFKIDHSLFTKILEIKPDSESELDKMVHPHVEKFQHCATAYLRSNHSAKTAGSGENHRVRFSIFSDMLWVVD